MKITWKITKKRGNWRPVLLYECLKMQEEVELNIKGVQITSKIPKPGSYHAAVFEGEHERASEWKPTQMHTLETPDPSQVGVRREITLPFRPGANPQYPEVEESFQMLQEMWEESLAKAAESPEVHISGSSDHTERTKKILAPIVARRKISEANTSLS